MFVLMFNQLSKNKMHEQTNGYKSPEVEEVNLPALWRGQEIVVVKVHTNARGEQFARIKGGSKTKHYYIPLSQIKLKE